MSIHSAILLNGLSANHKVTKDPRSGAATRAVVADKRQAILRAAVKVFAQKGYFNSKVSDIAGEAGIADGTVYLYFKSKDEILHSIFDHAMEVFIAEGKRELSQLEKPEDKLSRIAELHLELRGSIKFMQEFSAAGFADYLDIIRKTIEEGQRSGAFRSDIKPIIAA